MTTLTPEKEAELRNHVLSVMEAKAADGWSGDAFVIDPHDATAVALRFISTERQAREAAEKEVERLTVELAAERYNHAHAHQLRSMAEAKLAALVEAANKGRTFAVMFLAFDGRDRGTPRMDGTLAGLVKLAVTAEQEIQSALSALPPPVPTEEGGELKWTPFSTMEPEPGGDRDLAIKRLEKAKNIQQTDVARGLALVTRSDLIDMFHQWWWTIGVARHFKEKADQLSALRPSPISHEDRPLELAAADNNHKALVDGWQPIRTAPRDGTWFLACATEPNWGATRIVHYADKHDRLPIQGEGNMWPSPPTHWMPLPAPPQQAASAAATNKEAPRP